VPYAVCSDGKGGVGSFAGNHPAVACVVEHGQCAVPLMLAPDGISFLLLRGIAAPTTRRDYSYIYTVHLLDMVLASWSIRDTLPARGPDVRKSG